MGDRSLLPGSDDTIVAQATANGRGAIAVIRVSGAQAIEVARALGASTLVPREARRVRLTHPRDGSILDDALVTWFAAPRSYTGEELVEFATHGGTVTPARVLAACVAAGARPALPGEFTRRAVLNGKMDLLQAEAVADLIDARTTALQAEAIAQLDGGLSRRLLALREAIIHLEALIAYDVDFPEEDDGPLAPAQIRTATQVVLDDLHALLRTAPAGAIVRDGALVVIAGPPNAGKSSLFNALLGQSRAIVTPIAGTTRDAIEALLDREPWPLRLVDTAGLRDTDDTVERLGIEVSTRYVREAQVVLACGESATDVRRTVEAVRALGAEQVVPVHTKGDLDASPAGADAGRVSAESGEGLAALLATIDAAVASAMGRPSDTGGDGHGRALLVTRERHRAGLAAAHAELSAFLDAWQVQQLPATIVAVHLYAAREALTELIGSVDTEQVLDRVFRDFCIGK